MSVEEGDYSLAEQRILRGLYRLSQQEQEDVYFTARAVARNLADKHRKPQKNYGRLTLGKVVWHLDRASEDHSWVKRVRLLAGRNESGNPLEMGVGYQIDLAQEATAREFLELSRLERVAKDH